MGGNAPNECAVRVEHIHEPVAWPRVVVVLVGQLLFRERDVELAADVLNPEGSEV